jgi:hypothetical protein
LVDGGFGFAAAVFVTSGSGLAELGFADGDGLAEVDGDGAATRASARVATSPTRGASSATAVVCWLTGALPALASAALAPPARMSAAAEPATIWNRRSVTRRRS